MKQTCILFTKEDENQETSSHLSLVTFFTHETFMYICLKEKDRYAK
jgi:hypothetical protein